MVTGSFTKPAKFEHCARCAPQLTYVAPQDTLLRNAALLRSRMTKRVWLMMQSFDDAGKFGKEMADTGLKSFASVSKNMQAIAVEATEYSRRAFEQSGSALEKLVQAKSPDKAMEVQMDFARQAYEGFVGQATRMSELYADMAKEVYKPFEMLGAKAR